MNVFMTLYVVVTLAAIVYERWEARKFPANKICPKCPLKTNYLTGGMCQDCAFGEDSRKAKRGT